MMNRDRQVFCGPKEGKFPDVEKEALDCFDNMEDDALRPDNKREATSNFHKEDRSVASRGPKYVANKKKKELGYIITYVSLLER